MVLTPEPNVGVQARRKWCPDELGLVLLGFVVATFLAADAPVKLAVDDSLFKRSGKQVYGAAWQYDGSAPCGQGPKLGYGNNFVIVTVILRLAFMKRAVSLPVLLRRIQGGTQSEHGNRWVERILSIRETLRLQDRRVLDYSIQAATAAYHGQPAPSILPAGP